MSKFLQQYQVLALLIAVSFLSPCNLDTCSKRLGFSLDYHSFERIRIDGKTYCELVNQSLDGDEQAIVNLSKVNIGDAAGYQHGSVLVEVIHKISEQKYLGLLKGNFKENEINKIVNSYLRAGLEYSPNPKFTGKKVEEVFPLLSQMIVTER